MQTVTRERRVVIVSSAANNRINIHWWKKGLQSRFVKAINPGFRNRD
jgi:hypothetical protein